MAGWHVLGFFALQFEQSIQELAKSVRGHECSLQMLEIVDQFPYEGDQDPLRLSILLPKALAHLVDQRAAGMQRPKVQP